MKDKIAKSVKIVFKDGDDYEASTETGLNKSEVADWVERVFRLKQPKTYIEDYKKRKLVRDWAEINDIKTVLVCQTFNAWGLKNKPDGEPGDKEYMLADILFKGEKPEELEFGKEYTIPELCEEGEE